MPMDSFSVGGQLTVDGDTYRIFRLDAIDGAARLPFSLKVLLENLLRNEEGPLVTATQIEALAGWDPAPEPSAEIQFTPARVLLQDFTGVPCIVDLAAMREAMAALGGDPARINPLRPAELIIDHSIIADYFGLPVPWSATSSWSTDVTGSATSSCVGASTPSAHCGSSRPAPGSATRSISSTWPGSFSPRTVSAFPDTLAGTDSHTPMVNGLGVLGWGVGGIEAEAAMLGQPMSMLIPRVVGVKLSGELPDGSTATDLVLTIAETLRAHGVVGTFVEFYGPAWPPSRWPTGQR